MRIKVGQYKYPHFTVYYLNNVLALMQYSLYRGYIPIIEINKDKVDCNNWDWYFKQPVEIFDCKPNSNSKIIDCERIWMCLEPEKIKSLLYKKMVVLNDSTKEYVENEIKTIGITKKH